CGGRSVRVAQLQGYRLADRYSGWTESQQPDPEGVRVQPRHGGGVLRQRAAVLSRGTGVTLRTALLCAALAALALPCAAETIRVDAAPEHATNTIRPAEALGAGVDRLPYGAADKLFTEPTLRRILSAGWQTVTYRQNTELHTEAWHWNPHGTWSEAGSRGYFI